MLCATQSENTHLGDESVPEEPCDSTHKSPRSHLLLRMVPQVNAGDTHNDCQHSRADDGDALLEFPMRVESVCMHSNAEVSGGVF